MNLSFDFSAPFQAGSHASWTGSRRQTVECWTEKQSALLQVLANGSPMTRNELAVVLKFPLSSVCSILASVRDQIEVVDFETVTWDQGRATKRERFRVKR